MDIATKLMMAGLAVTASALSFASAASANPAVSAAVVLEVEDFSTTSGTVNSGGATRGETELGSLNLSAAVGIGENTLANVRVTNNSYNAFATATNGDEADIAVTVSDTATEAGIFSTSIGSGEL